MINSAKKNLFLLTIFVLVVLVIFYIFTGFINPKTKDSKSIIIFELSKLNVSNDTINMIISEGCKNLNRYEKFVVISGCGNKNYFKIYLEKSGYYLGFCTNWTTPREAVLKLEKYVGGCEDINAEDKEITPYGLMQAGLKAYLVCGKQLIFKDECIVGW
jgi:hypothetical protein